MRIELSKNSHENLVRVFVWTAHAELDSHVALATFGANAIYASHWPNWYDQPRGAKNTHPRHQRIAHKLYGKFFNKTRPRMDACFERDVLFEGRAPDIITNFYTLDVAAIVSKYNAIKTTLWSQKASGTHNCASFVAILLQAGGSVCKDFYSSLCKTPPFQVMPSRVHPHLDYYARKEREEHEIINPNRQRIPPFPQRCYDDAFEHAEYVTAHCDPDCPEYMKLVCFGDNHGICLSDIAILHTHASLSVVKRPSRIHVVKDVTYLPQQEIAKRLRAAIIAFRTWSWNIGWNDEHFARLVTTNDPISYRTKARWIKAPADVRRPESIRHLNKTMQELESSGPSSANAATN